MDEPARKRRKTISPGGHDRASSPLKKPPVRPGNRDRSSSPLKQPPRRPSFASPTKASLSRNYPSLLQRATPKRDAREEVLDRGKQARQFIFGDSPLQDKNSKENGRGQATAGAQQERVSVAQNTTPPVHRTARHRSSAGKVDTDEAELPLTPSQRALLEQDTPRRGILYSSPSKRPPLRKDPVKTLPPKPETPLAEAEPSDDAEALGGAEQAKEPPDPELEKKKQEKARLLRELQDLEGDVRQCRDEISKLQDQTNTQVLGTSERDDFINFINKISNGDAPEEDRAPPITSLLCSFLPFSTQFLPPPLSSPATSKPIPSHKPLDLDDPLPYLQMFTSFRFTSHLSLPESPSPPTHQTHTITLTGPQNLLTATLTLTLDTLTHKITSLELPHLSPWAARDLGAFARTKAQERDLGTVCWAIGSYWEIARKRAECWCKCERAFGHLVPGHASEDVENTDIQGSNAADTAKSGHLSRRALHRHLGRDMFILEDKYVLLRISWRIGFDWSGEAESVVAVQPALPRVCKYSQPAPPFANRNSTQPDPFIFDRRLTNITNRGNRDRSRHQCELCQDP
ncbi:hypothetical protein BDV95DRAFT_35886 [Massariosphaeria phaeospora]|uniref:Uncharacterized protein n=1 Tax=Massariosphaeria phaeospora TaxID=100035 RepID=A0A7C8MFK5_9PLEO|nr:hypothetical protein BDV95DRAFT_35886 [Massariosphaeria phaeospora]